MPTLQFFQAIYNWLLADISHVVLLFAAIAAITPTPKPGTALAKVYKVVDLLALNVLHAKSTGISTAALAEEVSTLLAQKLQAQSAQLPLPLTSKE